MFRGKRSIPNNNDFPLNLSNEKNRQKRTKSALDGQQTTKRKRGLRNEECSFLWIYSFARGFSRKEGLEKSFRTQTAAPFCSMKADFSLEPMLHILLISGTLSFQF